MHVHVFCICSHFKRYINIFVEFIPQVLFLMALFGWLVFLIFYKWCYHYDDPNTVCMHVHSCIAQRLVFSY